MKKSIFFLSIIFLVGVSIALADVLFSQPDDTGTTAVINGWTTLATAGSGSATQLHVKITPEDVTEGQTYVAPYIIWKTGNHTIAYNNASYSYAEQVKYCFTEEEEDTLVDVVFDFQSSVSFDATDYEMYFVSLIDSTGQVCSDLTDIGTGSGASLKSARDTTNTYMYFEIGDDLGVPLTSNSIEIVDPMDTESTSDFEVFQVNFSVADAPPVSGEIKVIYGLNEEFSDDLNFVALDNEVGQANVPKTKLLGISGSAPYEAYAELYVDDVLVETSEIIEFSVVFGEFEENDYYEIPTSTSTDISDICSESETGWEKFTCNIGVALFSVKTSVWNNFAEKKDEFLSKVPWGYFTLMKEKIDDITISSTSSPALSFDVAFGSSTTTLQLIDFEETEGLVGSESMSLIRNLMKWGFWLLFGLYLIFRPFRVFKSND